MKKIITVMLLIAAFACAPAEQEPAEPAAEPAAAEADVEAIAALRQASQDAHNAGDLEALMETYADDVVYMPPGEPVYEGIEAVREQERQELEGFDIDLALESAETHASGDWGFDRGSFELTMTPRAEDGGEPIQDNGSYVVIVSRQDDGSWKIARLIYNSDNPPPGTEAPAQ